MLSLSSLISNFDCLVLLSVTLVAVVSCHPEAEAEGGGAGNAVAGGWEIWESSGEPDIIQILEPGEPGRVQILEPGEPDGVQILEPGEPGRVQILEPGEPDMLQILEPGSFPDEDEVNYSKQLAGEFKRFHFACMHSRAGFTTT